MTTIQQADKEREKLNKLISLENEKKISEEQNPLFFEEQKNIEKNVKELYFLSDLIPKLKHRFSNSLEQKINIEELLHILKDYYEIYSKKEDLEEILRFIEIKNTQNFSLKEFIDNIKLCKLIDENNDLSQFNKVLKKINDVIYMKEKNSFLITK